MKTSLYQRYLVADQIEKRLNAAGAFVGAVYVYDGDISITLGFTSDNKGDLIGRYAPPEAREAVANKFLTLYPGTAIQRKPGYDGKPEMIISGVAAHGIEWKVDLGVGVCEKVLVGTKKVMRHDPEKMAIIPMVEVNEPVYEYLCADPIAAAGLL